MSSIISKSLPRPGIEPGSVNQKADALQMSYRGLVEIQGFLKHFISRKKKKEGGNYGQIFPKIVHQKIITVFEMQYPFCQILNAIQTNIKESKAFKRINLRLR